jgi:hypothetical protein
MKFMVKVKSKQGTGTGASAVITAPVTVTASGQAKPQVIKVLKADVKYRGARAEWFAVLQRYDGKPAGDFLAATTAKPPSLPKSQVQEKATGWLRFFVRSGIAQLV